MAEFANLESLIGSGTIGTRPFGEMSPLELLAQTLERAAAVGQENILLNEGAIRADEVEEWASNIAGAGTEQEQWAKAEEIRSNIFKYRIGEDEIARTFGLSKAEAEAAVALEGDIAGTVISKGGEFPHVFGGSGEEEEEEERRGFSLADLQSGFVSSLLDAGIGPDLAGQLWDWAESRFRADPAFTAAQAMIEVYDQPAFKKRFPAIDEMRGSGRRDVPTPYEYIQREKWLVGELERYGMGNLDPNIDMLVSESFINSIGTAEIQERLGAAARIIYEAPESVKQTFIDWYGKDGDAALMMTFLDPEDKLGGSWIDVKRNVESAEVGGFSSIMLDSRVAKERAQSIAALGLEQGAIWDKFATLKEQENLFVERIGETDLDLISHGAAAEFGVDGEMVEGEFVTGLELADLLARRKGRRISEFAGGGGAMITGSSTGFGAANA